jgi:hypothetical protein
MMMMMMMAHAKSREFIQASFHASSLSSLLSSLAEKEKAGSYGLDASRFAHLASTLPALSLLSASRLP